MRAEYPRAGCELRHSVQVSTANKLENQEEPFTFFEGVHQPYAKARLAASVLNEHWRTVNFKAERLIEYSFFILIPGEQAAEQCLGAEEGASESQPLG